MSLKKSTLSRVWSKNVWSTTKPSRATRIPGRERLRERDRAVALERLVPRLDGARHADREAAEARVVEGQRRAVLPEGVGAHRGRCRLAPVDRRHLAVARAVDDHEAAAADAARERLGDAEDAGRGDRSVDGVAAAPQRVDGGLRRERVDGRGRASRSDRGRRPMRAGVRQGAHLGGERGDSGDEQDGE